MSLYYQNWKTVWENNYEGIVPDKESFKNILDLLNEYNYKVHNYHLELSIRKDDNGKYHLFSNGKYGNDEEVGDSIGMNTNELWAAIGCLDDMFDRVNKYYITDEED